MYGSLADATSRTSGIKLHYIVAIASIIVIAIAYWPVLHAQFVWDDILDFVDMGWLTHGDGWKHYIFRDFNYWKNYFRPLVVALFTLQVRLFDVAPEPMHAVSLGMHLIDTTLVGLLAWRSSQFGLSYRQRLFPLAAAMLFYGLHPLLIEPVAWIGCQFDLAATMFMLLGLLANTWLEKPTIRATTVATCFFLAACSKESAAAFPLVLAIFDWLIQTKREANHRPFSILLFLRRNGLTYLAMAIAGTIYLALRIWALGQLIGQYSNDSMSIFGRLQQTCFIYIHYWKSLVWPMSGMSPVHPIDTTPFNTLSLKSIVINVLAIGTVACALYTFLRRSSLTGGIVLAVTAVLLPVLHISTAAFDTSLYHERYIMTALAVMCAMLPLARVRKPTNVSMRIYRPLPWIAILLWSSLSIASIRTTLPLWSDNLSLWRWAYTVYPDSEEAAANLLSAYIERKDRPHAHELIEQISKNGMHCPNCMLNAAFLAIADNDPKSAAIALEKVKNSKEVIYNKHIFRQYLLAVGQNAILSGQPRDAETILREVIALDPFAPQPRLSLAIALALQGEKDQARIASQEGIALLPPIKQKAAREDFDKFVDSDAKRLPLQQGRPNALSGPSS
jgi:tetratricopeptide (TPR) repeat protein